MNYRDTHKASRHLQRARDLLGFGGKRDREEDEFDGPIQIEQIEKRHESKIRMTPPLGDQYGRMNTATADDITQIRCLVCNEPELDGFWMGEVLGARRTQNDDRTEIWCKNCNTKYILVEADGTYRLAPHDDVQKVKEIRDRAQTKFRRFKGMARAAPKLSHAQNESAQKVYQPKAPGYDEARESFVYHQALQKFQEGVNK